MVYYNKGKLIILFIEPDGYRVILSTLTTDMNFSWYTCENQPDQAEFTDIVTDLYSHYMRSRETKLFMDSGTIFEYK